MRQLLLSIFIILLAFFAVIFFTNFLSNKDLISPLMSTRVFANNLWSPKAGAQSDNQPNITAQAAYFVDLDNGQPLYQKNINEKLPVASLTKIMTAVVTLEVKSWEDTIWVSNRAADMEPDKMLLQAGEKLTVEEIMYGIFLVSANDGAETLAEEVFGDREEFIKQMNERAKLLGMNNTLFINPTGLQEDGREQYSTAYDVALVSRYLIRRFPHVLDISSTYHKILPQTSTHQDYDMYSGINLLTTYPGVMGLKTGYTPEAGLTLVTIAKKEGHTILGVLLKSENRREEARELLDYSFQKLGVN